MKNAVQLLEEYTGLITAGRIDAAFALFAPDGVIEFPFFPSVGIPGRIEGAAEIRRQIGQVLATLEDFKFENVQIFAAADPNRAFGEYAVNARVKANGRTYRQLYGGRLEAENGRIKLLREFANPAEAARAFFPNGLKDVNQEL